VRDAGNRVGGYYTLSCHKSNGGYNLSGITGNGEFTFTFYTDSLKVGNYKYTATQAYVTDFGYPCYMAGPTDNMNINVTSYKNGRVSGNFTGQISPATMQGPYGPVFGTFGSVVIKNGLFSNVPVIYWYSWPHFQSQNISKEAALLCTHSSYSLQADNFYIQKATSKLKRLFKTNAELQTIAQFSQAVFSL
jgi:hypothetical protein